MLKKTCILLSFLMCKSLTAMAKEDLPKTNPFEKDALEFAQAIAILKLPQILNDLSKKEKDLYIKQKKEEIIKSIQSKYPDTTIPEDIIELAYLFNALKKQHAQERIQSWINDIKKDPEDFNR